LPTSDLERDLGYKPATPVREGVARFVEWFRQEYVPLRKTEPRRNLA
jgi:nucleoside-diphosphate-sugar epimerase